MIRVALAVAAGGAVGCVLRFYAASWVVAHWPRHYYLATLTVNMLGCLLIGLLSGLFLLRTDLPLELRTGLTVGLLGGLTTFSSFSLDQFHCHIHTHLTHCYFVRHFYPMVCHCLSF